MSPWQAPAFVIAICGTSGAGKSRLVEHTVSLLGDAVALHFDDYRAVSDYPADLGAWLERGANPDEWRTPWMAADLMALRAGRPVAVRDPRRRLEPRRFVVVEDPFGRARREMAPGIDFSTYLDLPMEIALARKLRRDLAGAARELGAQGALDRASLFFAEYLEGRGREAYLAGNQRARESCDLVLDGTLPVELLAREIVRHAGARAAPGPPAGPGGAEDTNAPLRVPAHDSGAASRRTAAFRVPDTPAAGDGATGAG